MTHSFKVAPETYPFDAMNLPKTIQYELEKSLNQSQAPSSPLGQYPPIDSIRSKEFLEHAAKLAHFKRRDEHNHLDDAENEESNAKRFKL